MELSQPCMQHKKDNDQQEQKILTMRVVMITALNNHISFQMICVEYNIARVTADHFEKKVTHGQTDNLIPIIHLPPPPLSTAGIRRGA